MEVPIPTFRYARLLHTTVLRSGLKKTTHAKTRYVTDRGVHSAATADDVVAAREHA